MPSNHHAIRLLKYLSIRLLPVALMLLGSRGGVLAAEPEVTSPPAPASVTCAWADPATAAALTTEWTLAIKSQHPDHITRLFSSDAEMRGFSSPTARQTYAEIREYYLYYFQFSPQPKFAKRTLEIGCNYLIQTGDLTWTLKARKSTHAVELPVRYRMVFEYEDMGWQIAEYIEELTGGSADPFTVPDPQPSRLSVGSPPSFMTVTGTLERGGAIDPALTTASEPPSQPLDPIKVRAGPAARPARANKPKAIFRPAAFNPRVMQSPSTIVPVASHSDDSPPAAATAHRVREPHSSSIMSIGPAVDRSWISRAFGDGR